MNIALISTDMGMCYGVRSLSSFLKSKGHKVKMIFNSKYYSLPDYDQTTFQQLDSLVQDCELIGISCMGYFSDYAFKILAHLKQQHKILVFGGIFATSIPERAIKHCDIVCRGEGELAFLELIQRIESGKPYHDVKNFWVKKDGEIIKNEVREYIDDIDELPMPDYSLEQEYIITTEGVIKCGKEKFIDEHRRITVMGVRGCPFSCSYCINSTISKLYCNKGQKIRKRSVNKFIEELVFLKKIYEGSGIRTIDIYDDDFFIRTPEELREFSKEYKPKIGLKFVCEVSPVTITEEKLNILLDAGLYSLWMGIQSGAVNTQKLFHRPIPNRVIMNTARLLSKYRRRFYIPVGYDVIIFNPYESESDLLEGINFYRELPPPWMMRVPALEFYEGTDLHTKAVEDGYATGKYYRVGNIKAHAKHLTKNIYLNYLLYYMGGRITRFRMGAIPRILFPILLSKPVINLNEKHKLALNSTLAWLKISQFFFRTIGSFDLAARTIRLKGFTEFSETMIRRMLARSGKID